MVPGMSRGFTTSSTRPPVRNGERKQTVNARCDTAAAGANGGELVRRLGLFRVGQGGLLHPRLRIGASLAADVAVAGAWRLWTRRWCRRWHCSTAGSSTWPSTVTAPAVCRGRQRRWNFTAVGSENGGTIFVAHHIVHQRAPDEAEHVAHRGEDDVLHRRLSSTRCSALAKFQDHDGLGAGVQLMLQLARR